MFFLFVKSPFKCHQRIACVSRCKIPIGLSHLIRPWDEIQVTTINTAFSGVRTAGARPLLHDRSRCAKLFFPRPRPSLSDTFSARIRRSHTGPPSPLPNLVIIKGCPAELWASRWHTRRRFNARPLLSLNLTAYRHPVIARPFTEIKYENRPLASPSVN